MTSSNNKIIIAAAGSGKTSRIVSDALANPNQKSLLVTYTINNTNEIRRKIEQECGHIPRNITVQPWFTFLLNDFVRPYQNYVYAGGRISTINLVNGQSAKYIRKGDPAYYLDKSKNIYTDKLSEFGFECNAHSNGLVVGRLEEIYDHIYIDEVQDLAGYGLELLEVLLKSRIDITLVGDHRQATFQTNHSKKNRQYAGEKIIGKFEAWAAQNLCQIQYLRDSFRCNQMICDLADSIYPDFPTTNSLNTEATGHDGIFIVPKNKLSEYLAMYQPRLLRYDRRSKIPPHDELALNFGDSKGLTFERVLIVPNGKITSFLNAGDVQHLKGDAAKYYVGITRAKHSVAFICDGTVNLPNAVMFE